MCYCKNLISNKNDSVLSQLNAPLFMAHNRKFETAGRKCEADKIGTTPVKPAKMSFSRKKYQQFG